MMAQNCVEEIPLRLKFGHGDQIRACLPEWNACRSYDLLFNYKLD